jgi:phosphatidylglycerophosphatase A
MTNINKKKYKMAKQFAKVTQTYSTKNKLQQVILERLEPISGTLFKDKKEATESIKTLFKSALDDYKGRAAVPELKNFIGSKDDHVYYVDEVISISIYNVKNDLS